MGTQRNLSIVTRYSAVIAKMLQGGGTLFRGRLVALSAALNSGAWGTCADLGIRPTQLSSTA
jgi:hypothetical protein